MAGLGGHGTAIGVTGVVLLFTQPTLGHELVRLREMLLIAEQIQMDHGNFTARWHCVTAGHQFLPLAAHIGRGQWIKAQRLLNAGTQIGQILHGLNRKRCILCWQNSKNFCA